MAPATDLDGLERCSPESKGVKSSLILDFLKAAKGEGYALNSFMLYSRGAVISEGWWAPYKPHIPHMMHSATKSFLSVAVGLAISEGYFSLGDKVISFFPDKAPENPDPYLAKMTVENLLTHRSGHFTSMLGSWRGIKTSWIDEFFKMQVKFEPGTRFLYSSATSFMLSAIIQRTTGQCTYGYLMPRLFQPLGMTSIKWDIAPDDINPGGSGIRCCTSDLLKLAILHLDGGMWKGQRILPKEWVVEATTSKLGSQYGYQWWTGPDESFYAHGMFGQFAFSFPKYEAILVTTGSIQTGKDDLKSLVWRHFPAVFESGGDLPDSSNEDLSRFLRELHVTTPLPIHITTEFPDISGRLFVAKSNADNLQGFSFNFGENSCVFYIWDDRGGVHRVDVGLDRWIEGKTTLPGACLHHGYDPLAMQVAARGAWSSPDTFEIVLQFVQTAFQDHLRIRVISNTEAILDRGVNVNSFATQRPPIAAYILGPGSGTSAGLRIADTALGVLDKLSGLADPPRTIPFSCGSASIGELLDHPPAKEVLRKAFPILVQHPEVGRIRRYNLYLFGGTIPQLTPALIRNIDMELGKLPL
jgi:CubicO group peptidase (beta-lactamase class C family)